MLLLVAAVILLPPSAMRCRQAQKMFRFFWRPGTTNMGDYTTKHHPGSHHKNVRPEYLTPRKYLDAFRGRVAKATGGGIPTQ